MRKSAMIRARMDPVLKTEVESIFYELGLTVTEAINLFYNQIRLRKGMPFEVAIPNKVTERTFKDTDMGKNIVRAKDAEDMFNRIGI